MKFRYIGDSDNMTAYGYDFRDGNEPEVEDANAIKRLSGNRFFEVAEDTVRTFEGSPSNWPKVQISDGGPLNTPPPKNKGGRPRKVQPTEA